MTKAAPTIENFEMRLVVDMQPFCPALPRQISGVFHQMSSNAPALELNIGTGIDDEGMNTAIPGDIHKTD